jgi:hypothetical protein
MNDRTSFVADQAQLFAMSFLLPGLMPLFALATIVPSVASWFGNATTAPTFAGAFFVVIGAIAVGFIINAVRYVAYERDWLGFCLAAPSPAYDLDKRQQKSDEYLDMRRSFYFHYLAYSNLSVAVPIALVIWISGRQLHANDAGAVVLSAPALGALVAGMVLVTVLLGVAACESIRRYNARRGELLGFKNPESPAA